MRTENCVLFYLRIQIKQYTIAAHISLDKKLKRPEQSTTLSSSLFYTIKAMNGNLRVFKQFFSASIYRTGKTLIRFLLQVAALFIKFPTCVVYGKNPQLLF